MLKQKAVSIVRTLILLLIVLPLITGISFAQIGNNTGSGKPKELPYYLKDRGTGLRTSIFGTYIRKSELVIYPFYEYTYDNDMEYKPSEFGYSSDEDFRGKFRQHEGLIFLGYGVTDWLAVEFESALITSEVLYKSESDTSNQPSELSESGFGDTQVQFDLRLLKEKKSSPEFNDYIEINFPFQKNRKLMGTQDWEFKTGLGAIKGFTFGTFTVRAALEYQAEAVEIKLGEYAFEYLKRISRLVRIYAGIEGVDDEVELITELQLHFNPHLYLKLNNGLGLTSKAPDWAPEIGIAISIF